MRVKTAQYWDDLSLIPREHHHILMKATKTYIIISCNLVCFFEFVHQLIKTRSNFAYVVISFVKTGVDSLNRYFCFKLAFLSKLKISFII
jgi:hypothetical protein